MSYLPDEILTPEESRRLALLPRAGTVDDLALERTVAALRERGLLADPKRRSTRRAMAVIGSIAAALVVFASGVAFGQRMHEPIMISPAAQVQRAGSAYVAAVVRLSETQADSVPATVVAGLQAGTATLHAAAASLARIDPTDPEVERLRTLLAYATATPDNDINLSSGPRVVWF